MDGPSGAGNGLDRDASSDGPSDAHPAVPAPEPYRIKSVEPIRLLPRAERARRLAEAEYNLFRVRSEDVYIDLLTDSGTGAMSARQWAAMMVGDEAYARATSFDRFETAVREVFGFDHVFPTHQGRAAERLLFEAVLRPGDAVVSNTLFDTTRANIEAVGGIGIDLPSAESRDLASDAPFKGDVDLVALERLLARKDGSHVRFLHVTITNNAGGGQPVSLANLRAVRRIADREGLPFWIDGCRFAENAHFIRAREPGQEGRSIADIVHDTFALADGTVVSAKKDGLANIGGFLAFRKGFPHEESIRQRLILTEGFPTYGGLAGRDLEAIAQGLREVIEPDYLAHRVGQVHALAATLRTAGVPVVWPPGGHAVFLDATRFLAHLAPAAFPGQALCCELYVEGGVRSVEIGRLMFGEATEGRPDLVRLALPRRVYTASHLDHVARTVLAVWRRRASVRGLALRSPADVPLRHFTARLAPLAAATTDRRPADANVPSEEC